MHCARSDADPGNPAASPRDEQATAGVTRRDQRAANFIIALALVVLTVAAFLPVRHNGFILYDDPAYITRNEHVAGGLTGAGLAWALTGTASDNWHPLTWASHMLDVTLFGMQPAAHHLTSLLLHALAAALLFLVLAALTGRRWPSALVAALFAIHPLHVESVAWASERKDVLSGLFWVLTMGAHLRYARRPGAGRYAVTVLCLAFGLLAKQMLVTLPLVLLLLDWWPLGRVAVNLRGPSSPGRRTPLQVLTEKIPLLALAGAAGTVTFLVQRQSGAVKDLGLIPLVPRALNGIVSYVRYLGKAVWPSDLSPLYPHPGPDLSLAEVAACLGVLLAVTLVVRVAGGRRPWLAVGWLWYLVTLLPVIGIVQVGWQGMADRYSYIPLVGIFLLLAWEAGERAASGPVRRVFVAAVLLNLAVLGMLTWRQTALWHDSVRLFGRAVAATPGNVMAEFLLGKAQRIAGNPGAAIVHLREAILINPRFPGSYAELAPLLLERGEFEGAVRAYERSLQLEPGTAATHNNLGYVLARLGRPGRALKHYEAALRIDPRHIRALDNAAAALARLGREAESAEMTRRALEEERGLR